MKLFSKMEESKREYVIRWSIISVIFFLFLGILYSFYVKKSIPDSAVIIAGQTDEQMIHDMTASDELTQRFSSLRDFDYIEINFSDHDSCISGKTYFSLYNEADELILYEEAENGQIHYGTGYRLNMPGEGGMANQVYSLVITTDNTEETGLGVFGYYPSEAEGDADISQFETAGNFFPALRNGEEQEYAISVGIFAYTGVFHTMTTLCILIMVIGYLVFVILNGMKRLTPQQIFLCMAIPLSLCFLIGLRANGAYDESVHERYTYVYSNHLMFQKDPEPKTMMVSYGEYGYSNETSDSVNEQAMNYWRILQDWRWTRDESVQPYETLYFKGDSKVIPYLPAILGLSLGRLLRLGVGPIWLLAQIFSLIAYLLIVYQAIRITPTGKYMMATVGSLPFVLANAAVITYDTTTMAFAMLLTSLILLWWKRSLNKKEWILTIITLICLGTCKGGVYFPMALLLFLVPFSRYRLSKKQWIMVGSIGAVGLLGVAIEGIHLISTYWTSLAGYQESGATYGIGYVLESPTGFLNLLINTTIQRGDFYLGQILGYRMAWMNDSLPWVVVLGFLLVMVFVALSEEEDGIWTNFRRILTVLFFLVEYVGIHMVLLTDTVRDRDIILAVQGRYFLPILPILLMGIFARGRKTPAKACIEDSSVAETTEGASGQGISRRENEIFLVFVILQSIYLCFYLVAFWTL